MLNYVNSYRFKTTCQPGQECYVTFESEPVTFGISAGPIPGIFYSNITTQPGYSGAIPGIFYNSSTTAPSFSGSVPGIFYNSTTTSPTFITCFSQNYELVSMLLPMTGIVGTTLFNDLSSVPKNISMFGNVQISDTESKWGTTSGYFDGSGDYLSTPGDSAFQFGTGDFTIEGWIKSTTTGSMNGPFGQFPSGAVAGKWDIKTRFSGADNFVFTYYTGSSYVDTAASPAVNLNDNVWHHIAVVRSGTTIYMFSDGVIRATTSISGSQSIGVNTHALNVGYNPQDVAYYTGYMNDFRITKGLARYSANFDPPTSPFTTTGC